MKLIGDRKSIYNKLLIYVSIIISVLLVMLSSILFYIYSRSVKDTINDLNTKILSQISYSSTYIDNLAKNYCLSVFSNNNVIPLMYDKNLDILVANRAIRSIDVLSIPDSYVRSVYVYNGNQDLFISNVTGGIYDSRDFYDKEIVGIIKNGNESKYYANTLFPRVIPDINGIGSGNTQYLDHVYTYIIRV